MGIDNVIASHSTVASSAPCARRASSHRIAYRTAVFVLAASICLVGVQEACKPVELAFATGKSSIIADIGSIVARKAIENQLITTAPNVDYTARIAAVAQAIKRVESTSRATSEPQTDLRMGSIDESAAKGPDQQAPNAEASTNDGGNAERGGTGDAAASIPTLNGNANESTAASGSHETEGLTSANGTLPVEIAVSPHRGLIETDRLIEQRVNELRVESAEDALPDADYTSKVGELLQRNIMMGGCELVSLEIVLESMGIDTDLEAIVSDFLDMNGNFATGYAGDPYYAGGGFAPGISAAANGYLESIGSDVRAHDLTGSSFEEISGYVSHGYPLLVWTTMGFEDPNLTGIVEDDVEWYDNEHCVVLYGFSEDGQLALVSDPLEGYVERDAARFADIYAQCGNHAVLLR